MTLFELRTLELEIRQRWRFAGEPGALTTGREILQSTPTGYDREIFTRAEFAVVARIFGHARVGLLHGRAAYAVTLRPPSTEGLEGRRGAERELRARECGCCFCKAVRSGALVLRRGGELVDEPVHGLPSSHAPAPEPAAPPTARAVRQRPRKARKRA